MKPAIRVENLSKQYRIGTRTRGASRNLTESILDGTSALWRGLTGRAPRDEGPGAFWALKDVSFEVQPGEVVGIIGRNGAGKSTLLKTLSRIAEPTSGRAVVRGRMASLLEVGTGFHPELTGRENVYLNGSILGMSRQEINRKFDEIVAFAEVEQFLDTPVKRYSSGMYVRLAFAVAAHLEPEILVIDEVLAVGDAQFQKKCMGQMKNISQHGRAVLFVSHNMGMISSLCPRALFFKKGTLHADGPARKIVRDYLCNEEVNGVWERVEEKRPEGEVNVLLVEVLDAQHQRATTLDVRESFAIAVNYRINKPVPQFDVGLCVLNSEGTMIFSSADGDSGKFEAGSREPGIYRSSCIVPGHLLAPGMYSVSVGVSILGVQTFEVHSCVVSFEVAETGSTYARHQMERAGVIVPVLPWDVRQVQRT